MGKMSKGINWQLLHGRASKFLASMTWLTCQKKKVAAVSAPAGLHLVGLQAVSAQAGLDLEGLQHSTAGKRSLYQLCVLPWNIWNANAQVMGCIYKAMLV